MMVISTVGLWAPPRAPESLRLPASSRKGALEMGDRTAPSSPSSCTSSPTPAARGAQREARALADLLDAPGLRRHRVLSLVSGADARGRRRRRLHARRRAWLGHRRRIRSPPGRPAAADPRPAGPRPGGGPRRRASQVPGPRPLPAPVPPRLLRHRDAGPAGAPPRPRAHVALPGPPPRSGGGRGHRGARRVPHRPRGVGPAPRPRTQRARPRRVPPGGRSPATARCPSSPSWEP